MVWGAETRRQRKTRERGKAKKPMSPKNGEGERAKEPKEGVKLSTIHEQREKPAMTHAANVTKRSEKSTMPSVFVSSGSESPSDP